MIEDYKRLELVLLVFRKLHVASLDELVSVRCIPLQGVEENQWPVPLALADKSEYRTDVTSDLLSLLRFPHTDIFLTEKEVVLDIVAVIT